MENEQESRNLWPSGLWTGFWTEPNRQLQPFKNRGMKGSGQDRTE